MGYLVSSPKEVKKCVLGGLVKVAWIRNNHPQKEKIMKRCQDMGTQVVVISCTNSIMDTCNINKLATKGTLKQQVLAPTYP